MDRWTLGEFLFAFYAGFALFALGILIGRTVGSGENEFAHATAALGGSVGTIRAIVASVWLSIVDLLNSNFMAALFGALFGALAAHFTSDRAKRRDELRQELTSANAAIVITSGLTSIAINSKSQYSKPVLEEYRTLRAARRQFLELGATEHGSLKPFATKISLHGFQIPALRIESLQKLLLEHVSTPARALGLLGGLESAIEGFRSITKKRNEQIEYSKTLNAPDQSELFAFIFCEPNSTGQITTEFADTVEALSSLTDDMIFFGSMLAWDLMAHAKAIAERLNKLSPEKASKGYELDYTESKALMPKVARYESWIKNFKSSTNPGIPRWLE